MTIYKVPISHTMTEDVMYCKIEPFSERKTGNPFTSEFVILTVDMYIFQKKPFTFYLFKCVGLFYVRIYIIEFN